ncbi:hypothetical protein L3Q82_009509, partial [Scortum barcoo]
MSLGWPGNASGSPRMSWRKCLGVREVWASLLSSDCCLRDPVPDQADEEDEDEDVWRPSLRHSLSCDAVGRQRRESNRREEKEREKEVIQVQGDVIVKYEASSAMGLTLIVTFVIKRAEESRGEVSWRHRTDDKKHKDEGEGEEVVIWTNTFNRKLLKKLRNQRKK